MIRFLKFFLPLAAAIMLMAACSDDYTPEIREYPLEHGMLADIEPEVVTAVKSDKEFRRIFDKAMPEKVDFGKEYLAVVRIDATHGIHSLESTAAPQGDGYLISISYTTDLTHVMASVCVAYRVPLTTPPTDLVLKVTKIE